MQELDLLGEYLVRLRQERLQQAHVHAMSDQGTLLDIKIRAHEAELCMRIQNAVKVLDRDPAKFVREFLP